MDEAPLAGSEDEDDFLPRVPIVNKRDKKILVDALNPEAESPYGEIVELGPGDSIDLHAFKPKEVASVVEEYLEQCRSTGFLQVRLIHGKGTGVQRGIIRSLLSNHPAVVSYHDAPAETGGWGATVVVLRPLT